MCVAGCVPIKFYLQKQEVGWILPVGHGFFFAHPHPPLNIPYPNVSQNAYFKILVGLLKEELSNKFEKCYIYTFYFTVRDSQH